MRKAQIGDYVLVLPSKSLDWEYTGVATVKEYNGSDKAYPYWVKILNFKGGLGGTIDISTKEFRKLTKPEILKYRLVGEL